MITFVMLVLHSFFMLSILIPTYNFDCLSLIRNLHAQCMSLQEVDSSFCYEIIVVDDASTDLTIVEHLRQGMRELQACELHFIRMSENGGHAVVRNRLLHEAKGTWVLMIDSDAEIIRPDFIATYWRHRHAADLIIGGIVHPEKIERGYELRSVYEASVAHKRNVTWRNRHPYAIFSVFNLMGLKAVIAPLGFDERCRDYGYEDFLLGMALQRTGATLLHIDNPLLHTGIDTSEVFLRKTETAMRTLSNLPPALQNEISLARWASRLRRIGATHLFTFLFQPFANRIRTHLLGPHPSIILFQMYKLYRLLGERNEERLTLRVER